MDIATQIYIFFISLCFLPLVTGQAENLGGSYLEPDDDDIELYDPQPKDPVTMNEIKCRKDSVHQAYEEDDLDYYKDNYVRYFTFVNEPAFQQMKASLTDATDVCYNVDVKNENGTVMGAFKCPLDFEHNDLDSCCGKTCAQFCCSPEQYTNSDQNFNALAFGLILVFAAGLGLLFYFVLGSLF